MEKRAKLVLIGDSAFAEIAHQYFTYDSPYDVVGFAVERDFMTKDALAGLPVVPFEDVERHFAPSECAFFAAVVYTEGNRLRQRLYTSAKQKGFAPASYISSRAFVWHNCDVGEHCFIFEHNVVQPFVTLGTNVVLWSGNHIGHHSRIGDHCFISSHVVISGYCEVGASCFAGVNATVSNNVRIGADCVIGAGALVMADVEDGRTILGTWNKRRERTTL